MPQDPFAECAALAESANCYWVEGLARLEVVEVDSWLWAREIFIQYTHANYEINRSERKLMQAGYVFEEDEEGAEERQEEEDFTGQGK